MVDSHKINDNNELEFKKFHLKCMRLLITIEILAYKWNLFLIKVHWVQVFIIIYTSDIKSR